MTDAPDRPQPELIAAEGPWGGPVYHHRGAEIRCNSYGGKTVLTGTGKLDLQVQRDRLATLDPQPIARYERRFPGFDDKIVSMYARGMSTREIHRLRRAQ